jgi:glycine betaine/proline transport system permease protein
VDVPIRIPIGKWVETVVGGEAGLGIPIIAIVLDRILHGITRRQKKALMRE